EVVLYLNNVTQSATNDAYAQGRLKLRPGDWIMLAGNMPNATPFTNPTTGAVTPVYVPRFSWYRVASCDEEVVFQPPPQPAALSGQPQQACYQVFATLIGQDWPYNILQNDQATIVAGVTAVYEKTVRLDYGSTF